VTSQVLSDLDKVSRLLWTGN